MRMRAVALVASVLVSLKALACENAMDTEDMQQFKSHAWVMSAQKMLDEHHFAGAEKAARNALFFRVATPVTVRQARRVLAIALRLGEYKEARAGLLLALKDSPDEPLLIARLAEAELGLGRIAEARKKLEDLSSRLLLPDADAQVALANARLAEGAREAALEAVKAALQQEPKHPAALAFKAQLERERT
jgi:tetratricopeptide (TPR) repeat protein